MNKKLLGIIGVLSVIIVIAGIYIFIVKHNSPQNETMTFNKTSTAKNGNIFW